MPEYSPQQGAAGSDQDIIRAIKMLEGIESSTNPDDIEAYKTNTRKVFEQLLIKLEENSDHIYSLEHRVKFLEQECEDKDLDIENVTSSMQDAVNDCRQEAEEMVGELMGKVSAEVKQRHEVEGLVRRLQTENSKMKDYAAMQKVPGWERNLDSIVEESVLKEVRVYQVECENLRAAKAEADQRLVSLQLQREAEMNATVAVIKFAQDKIEALHLQLKFQQKKEQQERQQRGNRKKGKKDSNNFNTPQKEAPDQDATTSCDTTPVSTTSVSPAVDGAKKSHKSDDKALHNKRRSRGKRGEDGRKLSGANVNSEQNGGGSMMVDVPSTPTSPTNSDNNDIKEEKVSPEILRQKSKSFWGNFKF